MPSDTMPREPAPSEQRFTLTEIQPQSPAESFAQEVRAGLTASPKRLACRFFYDDEGSALFEQICDLPEYYVTRAEREILQTYADEIVAQMPVVNTLVELGSGSASKTRLLIEALLRRQDTLRYVPIDISRGMLEASAPELLADYPGLRIDAVAAEYDDGLRALAATAKTDASMANTASTAVATDHGPKLLLWLGSNIGNFERAAAAAFLQRVGETMTPDDRLLVGIDLRKDRVVLEPAYDDAQGVTGRFNKNLLVRINRELDGHFDPDLFDHRAVYDEQAGRVEMYLVSRDEQTVSIDALPLRVRFTSAEPVHTENSYKYSPEEIASLADAAGFEVERRWLDTAGRFSENLLRPIARPGKRNENPAP